MVTICHRKEIVVRHAIHFITVSEKEKGREFVCWDLFHCYREINFPITSEH